MNLDHAYFITGNAYAGKSTLAKRLSEVHGGILCEENYHDRLLPELDRDAFPCLTYTRDLSDWRNFIRRTPEQYKAWYDGVSRECETLELRILHALENSGRPVFADTNISLETLKTIAAPHHVLVMLADPDVSVRRFFERPDREKQFLYRLIQDEPDAEAAMENYRKGLERINSRESYDRFLHAGFPVLLRDESRTVEQTLALAEQAFGLCGNDTSRFDIVSGRLVLTPLGTQYLNSVNAYATDAENTKYMIHLPNGSAEETMDFLRAVDAEWAKAQPSSYEFAILYRNEHIGAASIYVEDGVGELGWIVRRPYWGNGFATEAARAIVDHFAAHFGIRHFVAHCDAENVASYRIMEKLGMRRTAEYGGRKNRGAAAESTEYQYELLLDGKE